MANRKKKKKKQTLTSLVIIIQLLRYCGTTTQFGGRMTTDNLIAS